jgi:hypothetical protein
MLLLLLLMMMTMMMMMMMMSQRQNPKLHVLHPRKKQKPHLTLISSHLI